jgi:hypothetical protein
VKTDLKFSINGVKFGKPKKFFKKFLEIGKLGRIFSNFLKVHCLALTPDSTLSSLCVKFDCHPKMLKSPKHLMTFR